MATNRQSLYAFLALIFLILSVVLFYLFYLSRPELPTFTSSPPLPPPSVPIITPEITATPSVESIPLDVPSLSKDYPTGTTPTSGLQPTTADDTSPTPGILIFTSDEDNFSVNYSPLHTFYQDKFGSANRYTFYSPAGSFAIHVGSDWSWTHPDRQFNSNLIVAGQNTFVYNINLQTIIDIDRGDLKYTIQCVHNAKDELKNECAKFTNSFRFLN